MSYLVMPTADAALTLSLVANAFLISCCAALFAGFLARIHHADTNTIAKNVGVTFAGALSLCMVVMVATGILHGN
ncbi:hypothetical protein [Streptomyces sp. NPDC127066]|uniref:hypothetical protein n=1 Tax=Streptomyces sp. NPDC127066 TaxID=3347125 RepID=UPI00365BEF6F